MVIVCTNYDGLTSSMLHTKLHCNQPTGSGKDLWNGFYYIRRVGRPGHLT